MFNTVNMHVYHYAGNNPVKYVDPDGRTIAIDDAVIVAVFVVGVSYLTVVNNKSVRDASSELSGCIQDAVTDGASFVGHKTVALGRWAGSKAKDAVTWVGDKAKSAWDNIIYSRSRPKGAPDSLDGIERNTGGARNDRHAHSKKKGKDEWAINEDGTAHDGHYNRIPKDAAEFLRKRGFNIPEDRKPLKHPKKID